MNQLAPLYVNLRRTVLVLLVATFGLLSLPVTAHAQTGTLLIKGQINGLIDRGKAPATAYQTVVNGYIVNVDWSELQTSRGSELTANNAIDQAIANVRKLNAANAGLDMKLKLRVYAGEGAPSWAKNIGGAPFNICDDNNMKNGGDAAAANCGTVGRFWTTDFGNAYVDLQNKLAAKYDSVPEIRETAISRCTTIFAEPFQRQVDDAASIKAMVNAGLTPALDQACLKAQIDAHKVWVHTRSSLAVNPFNSLNGDGTSTKSYTVSNQMIDYCRQVLGERCVLGNNGLDKPPYGSGIGQIYSYIKSKGKPIYFQTKTFAKNSDLLPTFEGAATLGAAMVEMPKGYDTAYTPAQLADIDKKLEANASPAVYSQPPPAAAAPAPTPKPETKAEAPPPDTSQKTAPAAPKHHSRPLLKWLGIGLFAFALALALAAGIYRRKFGAWPPLNPKNWRRGPPKPPTPPSSSGPGAGPGDGPGDPPSIYPTPTRPSY